MRKINADDIPILDGWGIDLSGIGIGSPIWTADEWIQWHKLNVSQYDKKTADDKFVFWYDQGTFRAYQFTYVKNPVFLTYIVNEGIFQRSTEAQSYFNYFKTLDEITKPLEDIVKGVGSVTQAVVNTANTLTWLLPVALIGVTVLIIAIAYSKVKSA